MSSESELIKATVEAAIEPFRDLIRKLAGPAFEEIGLTLQDSVKVWRFKRLIRLWQKVKEYVDEAGISPRVIPKKLLHAAVEYGSLEEDDGLQDRWAALVSNAADPGADSTFFTAFMNILNQLSSREVKFLEAIYQSWEKALSTGSGSTILSYELAPFSTLLGFYRRIFGITDAMDYTDREGSVVGSGAAADFMALLGNLTRLGILRIDRQDSGVPERLRPRYGPAPAFEQYQLTALGIRFIAACQAPRKRDQSLQAKRG